MRRFFLLFAVGTMIVLQSCTIDPILYHSEASLPYHQRSTKTVLELIQDINSTSTFKFGVVTAKDNDTLTYVLLAPMKEGSFGYENLYDLNLTQAIPLLPKEAKEFIKILTASYDNWNAYYENAKGISYEYLVAPENLIVEQSENVAIWYSTLRFNYQNNKKGPLGTLIFGEGVLKYIYTLENRSEIKDLTNLLDMAVKKKL